MSAEIDIVTLTDVERDIMIRETHAMVTELHTLYKNLEPLIAAGMSGAIPMPGNVKPW